MMGFDWNLKLYILFHCKIKIFFNTLFFTSPIKTAHTFFSCYLVSLNSPVYYVKSVSRFTCANGLVPPNH